MLYPVCAFSLCFVKHPQLYNRTTSELYSNRRIVLVRLTSEIFAYTCVLRIFRCPFGQAYPQIGFEELPGILAQRLHARIAILQPGNEDLVVLEVDVTDFEQTGFTGSEAVEVDQAKEGFVAAICDDVVWPCFLRNRRKCCPSSPGSFISSRMRSTCS